MRDSASAFIFIGLVGDLEVETGEKQCPPGLTRIEPFSIYDEEQFGIRMDKEWCTGESLLEGVKCFSGNGVPGQGLGLAFEQVSEGTGDGAVVGNEPAVEIGESKEPL